MSKDKPASRARDTRVASPKQVRKPAKSESLMRCELCGREKPLSFHHLVPRAVHGKKRFQKRYTKGEMRSRGIKVCKLCHSGIHDLLTEKELAEQFPTKELLAAHPAMAKHIAWVKKQK